MAPKNKAQKRKVRFPDRDNIDYLAGIIGRDCSAVIGGTPTTFKALFTEERVVETAHDGEVLVRQTTLQVKRQIADCLDFNLPITVDVGEPEEKKYRIRDIKPTSNGDFSDVELAPEVTSE